MLQKTSNYKDTRIEIMQALLSGVEVSAPAFQQLAEQVENLSVEKTDEEAWKSYKAKLVLSDNNESNDLKFSYELIKNTSDPSLSTYNFYIEKKPVGTTHFLIQTTDGDFNTLLYQDQENKYHADASYPDQHEAGWTQHEVYLIAYSEDTEEMLAKKQFLIELYHYNSTSK